MQSYFWGVIRVWKLCWFRFHSPLGVNVNRTLSDEDKRNAVHRIRSYFKHHFYVWLTDVDDITAEESRHFLLKFPLDFSVVYEATPCASNYQFEAHSAAIYNKL